MPSHLSADRNMSFTIWPVTLIASPSPTIGPSQSLTPRWPFRWKDYAHGSKQRIMKLSCEEFLRRFLQHVLPRGFPRIRYFGWMANRPRGEMLPLCRRLLHQPSPATDAALSSQPATWPCPRCQGPMYLIERLTPAQIFFAEAPLADTYDTS